MPVGAGKIGCPQRINLVVNDRVKLHWLHVGAADPVVAAEDRRPKTDRREKKQQANLVDPTHAPPRLRAGAENQTYKARSNDRPSRPVGTHNRR